MLLQAEDDEPDEDPDNLADADDAGGDVGEPQDLDALVRAGNRRGHIFNFA